MRLTAHVCPAARRQGGSRPTAASAACLQCTAGVPCCGGPEDHDGLQLAEAVSARLRLQVVLRTRTACCERERTSACIRAMDAARHKRFLADLLMATMTRVLCWLQHASAHVLSWLYSQV